MTITDPDLTEEEIFSLAKAEWLGVLAMLWTAIGKPVEPDRMQVYEKSLVDIPLGLLEQAVTIVIRENTFNVVPLPGKIWEAVNLILSRSRCHNIPEWVDQEWKKGVFSC